MKQITLKLLLIIGSILIILSATAKDRVGILKKAKPTDQFMTSFLQFVKENNLYEPLVEFENQLINQEHLKDYTNKSFYAYIDYVVIGNNRCINRSIKDKLSPNFSKLSKMFYEYESRVEKGEAKKTVEYNLCVHLFHAATNFEGGLKYAVENSKLTPDKRWFYLLISMPEQTCESENLEADVYLDLNIDYNF